MCNFSKIISHTYLGRVLAICGRKASATALNFNYCHHREWRLSPDGAAARDLIYGSQKCIPGRDCVGRGFLLLISYPPKLWRSHLVDYVPSFLAISLFYGNQINLACHGCHTIPEAVKN